MKKLKYLLFLSVLALFSCEPENADEINPVPVQKESLEITGLQVLQAGGVKFEASYTGSANIENLRSGFLVSRSEVPTAPYAQDIAGTTSGKTTTGETGTDLVYNEEYYVRAYIVHTPENILYSEAASFVSLGSKAPEISSMNRSVILDTVSIHGKYFTSSGNYIEVRFGGEAIASVVKANDTLIQCLVPDNLERYDPVVSVELYGKKDVYEGFSLLAPSIEELSRNAAGLGDTLTVYGTNFDIENHRNKVLLGDAEAEILHSARDSIRFVIPERLSTSTPDLKVVAQLQESVLQGALTIKKPVISGFPVDYRTYETIEITGANFSLIPEENKIFFGDLPAEVLEASRTTLKVKIPIGPYPNRTPEVRIELMDYSIPYPGEVRFSDLWLMKSRITSGYIFRGAKHFVHNNKAYLFEKDYQDTNGWKVHVMDPTTETWSQVYVSYPRPELETKDYTILYNQESGRIFFYFSTETANFYEFNLDTKRFTLRNDFPGVVRGIPASFSIDSQLYIGLGRYMDWGNQDRALLSKFWRYELSSDTWIEIATLPHTGERSDLSVFVIDGIAYLGNGASDTGDLDFWKYSPAADQWTRLADFPGARSYTSFFEYGGKAYVYYGGALTGDPGQMAFQYDPASDTWKVIDHVHDLYFTYFIYPESTLAIRFPNAVYIGLMQYPYIQFFEADLNRL